VIGATTPQDELLAGAGWSSLVRSGRLDQQRKAIRLGATLLSDEVLEAMLREEFDAAIRNAAVEMLRMRGERGRRLAVRLATDSDGDVALQAIQALDTLQREPDVQLFQTAAHGDDPNIAQAALIALGHSRHAAAAREALRPFICADPWLQAAAIESLANLGDTSAVPMLRDLMDDPLVGPLALEAIGRIGGQQALEILCAAWLAMPADSFESHGLLTAIVEAVEGAEHPVLPNAQLLGVIESRFHAAAAGERELLAQALVGLGGAAPGSAVLEQFFSAAGGDEVPLPRCFRNRPDLAGVLAERAPHWALALAAECGERIDESVLSALLRHVLSQPASGSGAASILGAFAARATLPPRCAALVVRAVLTGDMTGRAIFHGLVPRFATALHVELVRREAPPAAASAVVLAALHYPAEAVAAVIDGLGSVERRAALGELAAWPDVAAALPWERWLDEEPSLLDVAARVSRTTPLPQLASHFIAELRRAPTPDIAAAVAASSNSEGEAIIVDQAINNGSSALLEALGRIRGAESAALLRRLATETSEPVRRTVALRALARRADLEDVPLFITAAYDEDWLVRHAAARALGRHANNADSRAALVRLACDSAPLVSDTALAALESSR
jgi:HEAT repeat protein